MQPLVRRQTTIASAYLYMTAASAMTATNASPPRASSPQRYASDESALAALQVWASSDNNALPFLVDVGVNSPSVQPGWLERSAAVGVTQWVLTGCSVKGSRRGQQLCASTPSAAVSMRFTAGVHPHDSASWDADSARTIRALVDDPNCGAVGECGLDYDRMKAPREVQMAAFAAQARMAVEAGNKSLFLHCRELDADRGPPIGAHADLLAVLAAAGVQPSRCCVHCFTGTEDELRQLLTSGFVVGITGYVCKADRGASLRASLRCLAEELGAEAVASQLCVETDAPYMRPPDSQLRAAVEATPAPAEGADESSGSGRPAKGPKPPLVFAKGREAEPAMTVAVCRTVAECLGMTHEAVAAATTARARALFFGG